ncbi:adenosylcobinamide-GDP ribazoletransferase [Falsibacillus albus]|uniref:Adenosylcobinamide-GDP ribazoletransferase n=1 Tax=Falsibacillus albus TaxID=2478915 RepID=A0A3L7K0V2_9BACI|nr:adenosylcobinamide-GDP ribazoletransferase [Falsibacillus albus]RLQ96215.1 adenosylcobinamide-GDP ribazoletransferase [Falsibacillus albus]
MAAIKGWWNGFLLNLQFFTIVPVTKSIEMNPLNVNGAVRTFPILGAFQGFIFIMAAWLLHATPFSDLACSFFLMVFMIAFTGGIHLDGWIDASDAYFSYQTKEKRLEVMKDPRTGAFGVLSIILLLAAKFLFVFEIMQRFTINTYWFLFLIPIFSKSIMGWMLHQLTPAKDEGLAYFFKKDLDNHLPMHYTVYLILIAASCFIINFSIFRQFVLLLITAVMFIAFASMKINKWFGGMTGDILGASVEGGELFLWMIAWLWHYFATV